MLRVAVPKATPSARERHAKCFCKPHGQSCAAALSQSTHGVSPNRGHSPPFSTLTMLIYHERGTVTQSSPRAVAVDTACARVCTASLMKMPLTWDFTVLGTICSPRAMRLLESPQLIERRMPCSRGLKASVKREVRVGDVRARCCARFARMLPM
jgi:hypothetical protein